MRVQLTAHMQAHFRFGPYTAAMSKAAGSLLRSLREASGLSLRELARQIGEQPTNLSYWERTGNLPRADLIIPIAQALGVSPEEILGEAKPKRAAAPGGKVRTVFEQVQKLPRRQQDKIVEVVEALLKAS